MSTAHSVTIEKLRGRDNYPFWKRQIKSYLVIKGSWNFTQTEITESTSKTDKDNDLKALSEITLSIEPNIYSYIDGKDTAKAMWDALEKSLSDSGLSRKVALLKLLTQSRLKDFDSIEKYVSEMLNLASRVKSTGLNLGDEVVASLMLAGLPNEYDSFVMTIENTQTTLSVDYVKTTLLQEAKLDNNTNNENALFEK